MAIPHVDLTTTQYALLAELELAPMPRRAADVSARGLSAEEVLSDAVPGLLWLGLIQESEDSLAITSAGTAVHYRAEHEKAVCRLAEVAAFADVLEAEEATAIDRRRVPHALRRLAQGTVSLEEAVGSIRATT
ncbi:hypothetical protein [Streptomyces chilikensis]|uniref:hypothetical protein n=1 Tax=Streptomyces chilikensis TaxID=1194079 RepID=UPI000B3012DD|nr:hypothetical protein [Streptomyces chilikensis]